MKIKIDTEYIKELIDEYWAKYINRYDKNGERLKENTVLKHYTGSIHKVVWAQDILAFVLYEEATDDYMFMSEWVADEWEVVRDAAD